MKHTRRGFFATLLAAVAAPLLPKPKLTLAQRDVGPIPYRPTTGGLFDPHTDVAGQWARDRDKIWNAMRDGQHMFYYDPAANPMLELWPKPMTAAQLIKNACDRINSTETAKPASFAEVNAMLDKWGAICSTNGPDRLRVASDWPQLLSLPRCSETGSPHSPAA